MFSSLLSQTSNKMLPRIFFLCMSIALISLSTAQSTSRGVGPRCAPGSDVRESNCTLGNGKIGTCDTQCATPKVPEFCCHERGPSFFNVFYCCESINDPAVVGGEETLPDEYPYMVALGWYSEEFIYDYVYKCGGVMINSKFAVTAAHCAFVDGLEPNVVLPGGFNLLEADVLDIYTIDEVIVHPEYDEELAYNDIALLRLVGEHTGSVLDIWRRPYIVNITFTALGYGNTAFAGTSSNALLKVRLQFVTNSDCEKYYIDEDNLPNGIVNSQICAKDPLDIMDTCQGDSGGPIIMTTYDKDDEAEKHEYLIGVTSFGQGCALSPPGVYTRVWCFLRWMDDVMRPYINDSLSNEID